MGYRQDPFYLIVLEALQGSGNAIDVGAPLGYSSFGGFEGVLPINPSENHLAWFTLMVLYSAVPSQNATLNVFWSTNYSDEDHQLTEVNTWSGPYTLVGNTTQNKDEKGFIIEKTSGTTIQENTIVKGNDVTEPTGSSPGSITGFGNISLGGSDWCWGAFAASVKLDNGWNLFPASTMTMDGSTWDPTQPLQGIEIGSMGSDV